MNCIGFQDVLYVTCLRSKHEKRFPRVQRQLFNSLCSVVVELSMHILSEDIPGKVVVSLRPARQLKQGQTLLKANWRPTKF